jgi:GNAT superfamily N-acetyltransferase
MNCWRAEMKILIDTNIIIGLEDSGPIKETFANFSRSCSKYGVSLFISPASYRDISNDDLDERRTSTLSKLAKYEKLESVPKSFVDEFATDLSSESRINHQIDIEFLAAVRADAVDFLVTQDEGIHRRAKRFDIDDRVLFLADAQRLIDDAFSKQEVKLPFIASKLAYQLDVKLPIFDSLREGYPEFDNWFTEKCKRQHRECWTIEIGGEVVGIVIYKEERQGDTDASQAAQKILKLCTFKLSPSHRGERYGEQLLKQSLWHAAMNGFDLVYVTAYEDQHVLNNLLTAFGFRMTYKNKKGELVLEKLITKGPIKKPSGMLPLECTIINYPNFYFGDDNAKHIVPIQADYFERLFPEKDGKLQGDLFGGALPPDGRINSKRTPGNTIRKVYVCRASTNRVKPGDVVVFYKSSTEGDEHSQCATTVGVVEGFSEAVDSADLVRMTSKRSVFTDDSLEAMFENKNDPVKVLDFLLVGHFENVVPLEKLLELGVVKAPPMSIGMIEGAAFERLMKLGDMRP